MPRRKQRYSGPYKIPDSDEEFATVELAERALDRREQERAQQPPLERNVPEDCAKVADQAAANDEAYAAKYPDEAEKYLQRAHRARTIAASIRLLQPS